MFMQKCIHKSLLYVYIGIFNSFANDLTQCSSVSVT